MLHETLRELVTTRGPGVLREAEELRGALDDFLAEDEATTGEVNVLVDAVRLGALPRLLTLLDGGAAPDAAISEVGDGLARDRGADDVRRPRWALAVLAYALGRIDGSIHLVAQPSTIDVHRGTQPLPPEESVAPAPPPPPPPPVAGQGASVGAPPPPPLPPVVSPTPEPAPPRVPPVIPEERSGRGRSVLVVLLALLLVAGLGIAGAWWWLNRDGDDPTADDTEETSSPSDEPTDKKKKKPKPLTGALPDNELVTSLLVGEEERLYRVDAETGEAREISAGPADTLPTISPDRTSVIYLAQKASGGRQLRIIDLEEETNDPLFPPGSPCEYGNRPSFNPNGTQFVLTCSTSSGAGTGLYVASVDGEARQISATSVGAPTWGADGYVYYYAGKEFQDSAIFRIPEAGGESEQVSPADSGFSYADPDWSEAGLLYLRLSERGDLPEDQGTPEGEVVYVDAGGTEQVVDIGETVGHPSWSADGQAVVFLIDDSAGVERVGVASLDDPGSWRPLEVKVDGTVVDGNPSAPAWGSR